MSDLNKWIGSGRLTRDAELRRTNGGQAVADISLCSNRVWSKDGNKQEEATFVDVTLWGKQAESLVPYLKKGTYITLEGRLQLDIWKTEEGAKRSRLRVVSEKINLVPRASNGSSSAAKEEMPADLELEDSPF